MIKTILYKAQAKSIGGRNGGITSDNGILNFKLNMQNDGKATNPEQLFAAGYAACFESTLQVMADRLGIKIGSTSVNSLVHFGTSVDGGYEISAKLEVNLPEVENKDAKKLIELAHKNCPYSKATRNNIEIEITKV